MRNTKEKRAKFLEKTGAEKMKMKIQTQIKINTTRKKKSNEPPFVSCFRTTLCDFCRRVLRDGSIRFNFTAACPTCLEKIEKFNADLRRHRREYRARFNGQRPAEAKV